MTESSFLERMEEMGFTVRKTNADRIRAMSDEELAKGLAEISDCVACETMFDMKCRCHHEFFHAGKHGLIG